MQDLADTAAGDGDRRHHLHGVADLGGIGRANVRPGTWGRAGRRSGHLACHAAYALLGHTMSTYLTLK